MKIIFKLAAITFFVILPTIFLVSYDAAADDKSCWFEATGPDDVYFVIREKTDSGGDREYVMWEGWVKKTEKKLYKSTTGKVRYDYRLSSDDLIYGDNYSACEYGQIIHVP